MSRDPKIVPSEITPQHCYQQRRDFLRLAGLGALAGTALLTGLQAQAQAAAGRTPIRQYAKSPYRVAPDEKLTPYEDVTTYNNFYEFGTDKHDPAKEAQHLKTTPWTISVEGEVMKPKTIGIDEMFKLAPLEERIYRMRCVEGWSMVIPWVGFELSALIRWAQPTGKAKYVEFISLDDPLMMPGQRLPVLDWPYREGLRMDEAMHPLTLIALGLYGEILPKQNGAALRLVVPWKYGFKGIKSIVKLRFTEQMPFSSWMQANAREYGFYANVNPQVDHPRWTQSSERRIGDGLFARRRKTLMFNGYAEKVAHLYQGMDLTKHF